MFANVASVVIAWRLWNANGEDDLDTNSLVIESNCPECGSEDFEVVDVDYDSVYTEE